MADAVDYAVVRGKIRAYGLEIHAAEHCNLRCAGCSKSSPLLPPSFPSLTDVAASLRILSTIFHADRATILGGEPLLNPDLAKLLAIVRQSGVFDAVHLTTNGLLLLDTPEHVWKSVDVVELSLYPSTKQALTSVLPAILDRAWQFRVQLHILPTPLFRHILLTEETCDPAAVRSTFSKCYYRHYSKTLQNGKLYQCAPSTAISEHVHALTGRFPITRDSALELTGAPDLQQRLLTFLRCDVPLDACRYCLGSGGGEYAHHQLSSSSTADIPAPA